MPVADGLRLAGTEPARLRAWFWQDLLTAGLYVNLIVPPGCPKDECVLRASCSAAYTPDHLTRALDIFARVGAELGVARAARP